MDALYILGSGSKFNNEEIRFSFRSLEKHYKPLERIFVVGKDPGFFSPEVTYVPWADKFGSKVMQNSLSKTITGCRIADLSDDFLFMYDDQFYIRDMESQPYYHRQDAKTKNDVKLPLETKSKNLYVRAWAESGKILQAAGKPMLNYTWHHPVVYNKHLFLDMLPIWKDVFETKKQVAVRSLYCNWNGVESRPVSKDCKMMTCDNLEHVERFAKDQECLSLQDNIWLNGIYEFLHARFPEKSRFEI